MSDSDVSISLPDLHIPTAWKNGTFGLASLGVDVVLLCFGLMSTTAIRAYEHEEDLASLAWRQHW